LDQLHLPVQETWNPVSVRLAADKLSGTLSGQNRVITPECFPAFHWRFFCTSVKEEAATAMERIRTTKKGKIMADIQRSAEAVWSGDLKSGQGSITTDTGVLKNTPYSFKTRFENEKQGTNPEELIAAAHASCFSMAFSKLLADGGHPPKEVRTKATLTFVKTDTGFKISKIHLDTTGKVDGIDQTAFQQTAEKAKEGCPVSRLLKPGLDELSMKATLQK
jgi:lipoyl-dependent peroxiredoxin